jgi:ferredoxin-type protein NapG
VDRKEFFKKGFKKILGAVKEVQEIKEEIPSKLKSIIDKKEPIEKEELPPPEEVKPKRHNPFKNLQRPPGAIPDKKVFEKKCTGCGDCINACPYNVIFPVYDPKLQKSIPFMDVNVNPCLLCSDFPCIQSCNFDALVKWKKKEKPKFGQAKLNYKFCLNHGEKDDFCNRCAESCPVKKVVTYKKGKPMFSTDCTGCGICVMACPTFPKAIVVTK